MAENYTADVSERIEDLVVTDVAGMWAEMARLDSGADSEKWRATLTGVAKEYLMSGRFALLRLLRDRTEKQPGGPETDLLREVSMERIQNLSAQEHRMCLQMLLEMAGPSPEEDPDLHERILYRAWHDEQSANAVMNAEAAEDPKQLKKNTAKLEKENKKRYGTRFTREEAFQLGHILRFTLEEMQKFLLRVFDVEDGFRMNRSSDVIEAYCFLTDASCARAEEIKARYLRETKGTEKREDTGRRQNWTRQTTGGLLESVENWKRRPETMDENFLSWLIDRASGLDVPSYTARRVYRNLAAYAYGGELPDEEDLLDDLLHIADMDEDSEEALEYLFSDGNLSEEKCAQVAEQLYLDNKSITDMDMKDNTKAWSVVTLRQDKELSVSYGTVNSSRSRIQSLLLGREEVEKGDLLYLLWFTFNLIWGDSGKTEQGVIYDRIFDLKDAAAALLESALLPPFYPPHLMEQSMLLSVIYAGKTGTDPAAVYGTVQQSLRSTRNAGKKSGKHSLQEQIDIIRHYRDPESGMTLKQCSLLYGISEQTISRWQKELTEKGLI